VILPSFSRCSHKIPESGGSANAPVGIVVPTPDEEDLSVPIKNVLLNYKIVLFSKLCQKFFDIMVTGFSFLVAKLKNLSMCILNLLKNMQNFGLIQFCWLNPMDI